MHSILGWKICPFALGSRYLHNGSGKGLVANSWIVFASQCFPGQCGAFMLDICCSPTLARVGAIRLRGGNVSMSNGAWCITLCAIENKRGHWEFAHKVKKPDQVFNHTCLATSNWGPIGCKEDLLTGGLILCSLEAVKLVARRLRRDYTSLAEEGETLIKSLFPSVFLRGLERAHAQIFCVLQQRW